MHIVLALTFTYLFIFELLIFVCCKNFYVLKLNNCVCKVDKNKHLNRKNRLHMFIRNVKDINPICTEGPTEEEHSDGMFQDILQFASHLAQFYLTVDDKRGDISY